MMRKYTIYVSMPTVKFKETIVAETHTIKDGRINFENVISNGDFRLVASYPSCYTIIELIEY